jgi:hypothetical protein
MKYAPLGDHLRTLPASRNEITLRFAEIETIIGAKLPGSASTYREWWANQAHGTHAPYWQEAGFLVDGVDLSRKTVRFVRGGTARKKPTVPTKKNSPQKPATPKDESYLLKAGFERIGTWERHGESIHLKGDIPKEPGTYAHIVNGKVFYVGSATMGVKKRLKFYEKPGRTQTTSIRIKALIIDALTKGKDVSTLSIQPEPTEWNGLPVDLVTGIETGLVKKLSPPWNKRGVGKLYAD